MAAVGAAVLLSCTTASLASGQEKLHASFYCSYFGEKVGGEIYQFSPSNQTNRFIDQIMNTVGLRAKFEVKAANVPNAAALVFNNKRYILYNQNFVTMVNQTTKTDWAAVSILAHEIGHHLNGHTLGTEGSRPSNELEADEFSGFVLKRMGATLLEAQAAMKVFADEDATDTHPGRQARMEAIALGWTSANENKQTAPKEVIAKGPEVKLPTHTNRVEPAASTANPPLDYNKMIGKVVFKAAPEKEYYLTKSQSLILKTEAGTEEIGRLAKSNNISYPLMILNKNSRYIYIDDNGELYNKDGESMGYIAKL